MNTHKPTAFALLLCLALIPPGMAQAPTPAPEAKANLRAMEQLTRRVEEIETRLGRSNRTPTATYNLERRLEDIEKRIAAMEKKVSDLEKLEQRVRKLETQR
jgi:hypothetical protein